MQKLLVCNHPKTMLSFLEKTEGEKIAFWLLVYLLVCLKVVTFPRFFAPKKKARHLDAHGWLSL